MALVSLFSLVIKLIQSENPFKIGERIKEEEKNEEIRIERLKAKKEVKKEIRENEDHKNSQNLIKEIKSEKRLSSRIDKQDSDPLIEVRQYSGLFSFEDYVSFSGTNRGARIIPRGHGNA